MFQGPIKIAFYFSEVFAGNKIKFRVVFNIKQKEKK